jgi:hypothetical protein
MASEEEQIRKLMESEMRVKALTGSLDALKTALAHQIDHLTKMGVAQTQVNAAWANGLPAIAAQQKALDAAHKDLAASSRNMGAATLYASNALQDFQAAGMRGVLNNIPQILQALGAGSGLAGVAMAVGVAFEAASPFIQKFMEGLDADRVGAFMSAADKAIGRLEELKKAASLSPADKLEKEALEKGVRAREAGLKAGEAESERIGHPGPEVGKAVAKVLAESASSKDTLEGLVTSATKPMGDEAADKYERDVRAEMEKAIEANRKSGSVTKVPEDVLRGAYEKKIREGRAGAHLNAQDDARTQLGSLLDNAKAGDPAAIASLVGKLRGAGNGSLAAQIEEATGRARLGAAGPMGPVDELKSVRDDEERRRKEAGHTTVPDLMKPVRDDEERRDREEQAEAEAKQERERRLEQSIKDHNRGVAEKKVREIENRHPEWGDKDRQESDLMRAMGEGVVERQERTSHAPMDQSNIRRDRRWKLDSAGGGAWEYSRQSRRAVSLEEASKMLGDRHAAELVKQGVDPQVAAEEGEKFGKSAYGAQMQRGYDSMKQLQEMGMTGQLGRGVQMMGGEAYIDSVQTAREGVDKQMLEYQKLMAEAAVATREWQRVNGVAARVGNRGKR